MHTSLLLTLAAALSSTAYAAGGPTITLPSNPDDFLFPHFIVEIDSAHPNRASGTGYTALVNATTSSLFDFDIPPRYKGRTCELVFFFPSADELGSSSDSYQFSPPKGGNAGLVFRSLKSPATAATTYNNEPVTGPAVGYIGNLKPGNTYRLGRGTIGEACAARQKVGYKMEAEGATYLDYFQTYQASQLGGGQGDPTASEDEDPEDIPPIGLFIIAQ